MSGQCGTRAGYDVHRRAGTPYCEPCRRAAARYEQERQLDILAGNPRMVDATGTRRRIQALIALGYRHGTLAAELGVSHDVIRKRTIAAKVNRETAAAVAAMYDRLSMRLPVGNTHGEKVAISRARNLARRNGWLPPLAYDEGAIDDPNETPTGWEYLPPTRKEQLEDWIAQGRSISQVCYDLRISKDSLERWCLRHKSTHLFAALTAREYVKPGSSNQYTAEAS